MSLLKSFYSKSMEVTFYYLKEKVQVRFDVPALGIKTTVEQTEMSLKVYQQLLQNYY
jgi:hypothetical protein